MQDTFSLDFPALSKTGYGARRKEDWQAADHHIRLLIQRGTSTLSPQEVDDLAAGQVDLRPFPQPPATHAFLAKLKAGETVYQTGATSDKRTT